MRISIIGAGPRGLSVALYALYKGHKVTLIDPQPLHTWSSSYLISDLEMRSPLSFDLVTYLEELQEYSLANFLSIDKGFTTSQVDIEKCSVKVSRHKFCNYLNYIFNLIKNQINVVEQYVIDVKHNTVLLQDNSIIESDAVVFCNGYVGKVNIPNWLKHTNYLSLQTKLQNILTQPVDYLNKEWLVIGSGQGSAEIAHYLCDSLKGKVHWATKYTNKVYQYPAPDYKLWGVKSALGSYYRSLTTNSERLNYLSKVKKWQPSITPYICEKLNQVQDRYSYLDIDNFNSIKTTNINHIVLAAGIAPSTINLPTSTYIPLNKCIPTFPDISKAFRLNVPNTNWYVSGILATAYDGPRQHSIISAGITAKEIIQDIENGSI